MSMEVARKLHCMIPVSVSGKPMAAKKAKETDEASRSTTNDVPSSDGDGVPDGGGIGGRADNCGDDDDDDDAVEVASSAANESEPPSGDDLAEHRRAAASSQRQRSRGGGGGGGGDGGGGKRKRGVDAADDEGDAATASDPSRLLLLPPHPLLSEFKNSPHHLRISASSVSALCGLHPFQDLPTLLFDLVYQSRLGQRLLRADARALGLTLVDARERERETMLLLASAASDETRELVEQVLGVSGGTKRLESIEEVRSIQDRIKSRAIEARGEGRLSARQVESLLESSRGHVSTGFGTCHEDDALDLYESRFGCRVRERNEALVEWRFRRMCDVDGELGVTAEPIGEAIRRRWKRPSGVTGNDDGKKAAGREETMHAPEVPIEIDCDDKSGIISSNEENEKRATNGVVSSPLAMDEESQKPFFRIVGAVDGIRDELYMESSKPPAGTSKDKSPPASAASSSISNNRENANKQQDTTNIECNFSDDEEDNWTLRPIIVECKHRMKEAKVPPPLYDQIQTCLYCHMYNVKDADLVQVVRRKNKRKEKENDALGNETEEYEKVGNGECKTRSTTEETKITVTRVSLNDPIYNHNHHWHATLLPRLASFADAVYSVRKDDGKRYRLLMAQSEGVSDDAEEESWRLLWEECPWLRHCDTSFAKRRRF